MLLILKVGLSSKLLIKILFLLSFKLIDLNIIDPFNKTKNFKTELEGDNFAQTSNFGLPFRSFGVNFSYKFGKLDFKAKSRKSSIKNDDQKQGDADGGGQGGGGQGGGGK